MTLAALGARLREERMRVGLDQRSMAAAGGVSRNSQLAYEAGKTPPSTDYLLALQATGIDVPYLFTGARQPKSNILGFADEADWVMVPTHDLADLTDGSKGEASRTTPIRRDWLNRALGATSGLWLTTLPCDYLPQGLLEGEKVLCRDIDRAHLRERNLCIWRDLSTNQLIVGRFSVAHTQGITVNASGEYWINPASKPDDMSDGAIVPIARIVGRSISQIR